VSGLVVGGYGDCHGGEVDGVGLDAPGHFEPPPGGGVVGEGVPKWAAASAAPRAVRGSMG